MRAFLGTALAAVLILASTGVRAQDDEPKFDKKLLIGKWEPTDPSKKGTRAVMDFKKGDKVVVTITVDDKDLPLDGTYSLKDDKLSITLVLGEKEETTDFKLKKLDEKSLEYTDAKGKAYALKRSK